MVISFSLKELIHLIKKRFFLIILIALICMTAGFLYSKVFVAEEYRAQITLNFNKKNPAVTSEIDQIRYNLLEQDVWLKEVLTNLNEKATTAKIDYLQSKIFVEQVPKTTQANILLQLTKPAFAKKLAQNLAQVIPSKKHDLQVSKNILIKQVASPWKRITILSLFFGCLLGYFLVVVLEVYRLRFDVTQLSTLFKEKRIKVKQVSPSFFLFKRSLDFLLGCFGLLFFLIVYLLLIIPYSFGENKGPILFRQRRFGLGGTMFSIYKFRSMKVNAEKILQEKPQLFQKYLENDYKLPVEEDPRITKLGVFLRKTSIDELPQFINIVKGDMSLVGPRPIITEEIKEYGDLSQLFFSMKPGITGVWGVSGRSSVNYPKRKDLELSYLEKRSILFDFKIIFKTIGKVLEKEGAY